MRTAQLIQVSTGKPTHAKVSAPSRTEATAVLRSWTPVMLRWCALQAEDGEGPSDWPQDWNWDWHEIIAQTEAADPRWDWHRGFVVTVGQKIHGLMIVAWQNWITRHESHKAKPAVYVDYLATAPWNREHHPKLKHRVAAVSGVGKLMVKLAIETSREQGFEGRLALHALSKAEGFYRRSCGMIDMGNDDSAVGQGLKYFEMLKTGADAFLDRVS